MSYEPTKCSRHTMAKCSTITMRTACPVQPDRPGPAITSVTTTTIAIGMTMIGAGIRTSVGVGNRAPFERHLAKQNRLSLRDGRPTSFVESGANGRLTAGVDWYG